MNLVTKGLITLCGAAALSVGVYAQDNGRYSHSYYQDRDHNGYQDRDHDGDRDRGAWDAGRMRHEFRGAFADRLQADLDRAEHAGYLRGDDYRRFERAHREVAQFQEKWGRGVFDPHDMDDAIGAVQRVVDTPALRHEDRDALREDLFAMRRFRAHMEARRQ